MSTKNLNSSTVERLEVPPDKASAIFYDEKMSGFAVRVTAPGAKTYLYQGRVNGRLVRVRLGRSAKITCEDARKKAKTVAQQMTDGIGPNGVKRRKAALQTTLDEALNAYLEYRGAQMRESSQADYRKTLKRCLPEWLNKPLTWLSRDRVKEKHQELSNINGKRGSGKAQADKCMRYSRAVFNFATEHYRDEHDKPLVVENPVKTSLRKKWNNVDRRQTIIKDSDLPKWYIAVCELKANGGLCVTICCSVYLPGCDEMKRRGFAGQTSTSPNVP